jgi:uncharacterized membrane protein YccC
VNRLGFSEAMFAINSFAAAMLALYIAFSLGLPRPYWAMLTVYITVQPLSGALRSKAVYRVIGTVMGGAAAVILVPNLVGSPAILSLALAGWVGVCLYLSLLDRTPRAYVFMLAGYTAAIIGFPGVGAPGTIFDTALERVEEITLGIVCATAVHTVFFPRSVLSALTARITAVMGDVEGWAAETWTPDVLAGRVPVEIHRERRRLAADVTELYVLSTHLPFDTASLRPTTRTVRALQDRLSLMLPLASAVEDRRQALAAANALPEEIAALLGRVRDWISRRAPESRMVAQTLQAACNDAAPEIGASPAWTNLLKASLLGRLAELIDALQDARDLAAHISAPSGKLRPAMTERLAGGAARPLHRDHGLAALSGLAAAAAILACCAFWIATAWPDGAVAPMMAAVFASFFAAQDDPGPPIARFLIVIICSLPIAAIYLFATLPAIDGFAMLTAVLAPAFLVMGALQANPKLAPIGIALLIGVAGALSLQEVFSADFASFINGFIAQAIGIAAALTTTQLLRSVGADWSARRILRFGWRELAANAATHAAPDGAVWTSRMLDRLGLFLPRLAIAESAPDLIAADPLNDLRIGINVVDLQRARPAVDPFAERAIVRLLDEIAAHFRTLGRGRRDDLSPAMLEHIDRALDAVAAAPASAQRRHCLWSLAGLRRNLFPDAPSYVPAALGAVA